MTLTLTLTLALELALTLTPLLSHAWRTGDHRRAGLVAAQPLGLARPLDSSASFASRLFLPALQRGIWYDGEVTFGVIGDYGFCPPGDDDACAPEVRVADMVKGWDPAFIVTTGDNNYPRGKWDTWERNTEPYRAYIPDRFEPAVGNHDYICSQCPDYPFRANFRRELTRQFAKPDERDPLVRFFMIDSNAADSDGNTPARAKAAERSPLDAQHRWLERGLAATAACWKVVVMHHPPYSSSVDPGSNPLLSSASGWNYRQWGADVVLSGHAHSYERITRPGGFAYIVDGTGGAPVEPLPTAGIAGSVVRVGEEYGAIRGHATAGRLVLEYYTIDVDEAGAAPVLRDTHAVERDCNAAGRPK